MRILHVLLLYKYLFLADNWTSGNCLILSEDLCPLVTCLGVPALFKQIIQKSACELNYIQDGPSFLTNFGQSVQDVHTKKTLDYDRMSRICVTIWLHLVPITSEQVSLRLCGTVQRFCCQFTFLFHFYKKKLFFL